MSSSTSESSRISVVQIHRIMENLKGKSIRETTTKNYLVIWRLFNAFLLRLEEKPKFWEERVSWFIAYLIDQGKKSATIKSYISALKTTLIEDGYGWNEQLGRFSGMIKASRLKMISSNADSQSKKDSWK